ncbi:MAG: DUF2971 domain-containing protein [Gammaproteobacteria bacterium]|nr:DUF2971 domain-containing protein [Gammaproteobacteria bacterium]
MEDEKEFDFFLKIIKLSESLPDIESKRNEIIQDLSCAKDKLSPRTLFHYTDLKGIDGIVGSNNLRATHYKFLNDSTEIVYGLKLLTDEIESYLNDALDEDASFLLRELASLYSQYDAFYGQLFKAHVISFSEDSDVLSQWRAYSNQATGFCVGFNFFGSNLITVDDKGGPWFLELLPVIYDNSKQKILIRKGIEKMLAYLNSTKECTVAKVVNFPEEDRSVVLGFFMRVLEPFVAAFKHSGFHEEKEWRAVAVCPSDLVKEKMGVNNFLECIFIQGDQENLWQTDLLPITSVTAGPLSRKAEMDEVKNRLLLKGYGNQVVYSKSEIPLK